MYCTFNGNLGRDAQVKTTKTGVTILSFTVANTTGFGDSKKTTWINCTDFRSSSAEKLLQYLKKGQSVLINGVASLNEYQRDDGSNSTSLQCIVSDIKLLSSKKSEESKTQENKSTTTIIDDDDFIL